MLADQIKQLRDEKGLSTQELAELSGIPVSTLNRIFNGQTPDPKFQTVVDIVKALGGSLDELVGIVHPKADQTVVITQLKKVIHDKNKWLVRLYWFLGGLLAMIVVITLLHIAM